MKNIVLFHSGLGLRPHLQQWKARLDKVGFRVHTPDLYDGEVFDDLEGGVAKRDALGIPEIARRAAAAVEELPSDLIYIGFSMGSGAAQSLAMTRPGARGLVMMHGVLPPEAFGCETWTTGLRAQLHVTESDPWVDAELVTKIAQNEEVEHFAYAGGAHLFADTDHEDYDEAMAEQMFARVASFCGSL